MENIVDTARKVVGLARDLDLANKVGVSKQAVNQWRRKNQIPSGSLLRIIRILRTLRPLQQTPDVLYYADLPPDRRSR